MYNFSKDELDLYSIKRIVLNNSIDIILSNLTPDTVCYMHNTVFGGYRCTESSRELLCQLHDYLVSMSFSLPTNDFKASIVYSDVGNLLNEVQLKLERCRSINIDSSHKASLQLCDEFNSATIEGARTTLEKILNGRSGKSETMVRQSLVGLQYLMSVETLNVNELLNTWRYIIKDCCDNVGAGIDGFRTGMVYVASASRIVHTPAHPKDISTLMQQMFQTSIPNSVLRGIVYSFYVVYVHPFADGNGRLSRAILQRYLGVAGLPLSKAIRESLPRYYKALQDSEHCLDGRMDIAPYVIYILNAIGKACNMYELYSRPLTDTESLLVSRMDRVGRGYISVEKAHKVIDADPLPVLNSLVDKGYLSCDTDTGVYCLLWKGSI